LIVRCPPKGRRAERQRKKRLVWNFFAATEFMPACGGPPVPLSLVSGRNIAQAIHSVAAVPRFGHLWLISWSDRHGRILVHPPLLCGWRRLQKSFLLSSGF